MATVQDYLNMAVSLTVGNKSGTSNQVLLPDDFRKLSDLKVKRYSLRTSIAAAGSTGNKITTLDANDSLCLVFFSHPVVITHINEVSIAAQVLPLSFISFGRNITGSANFKVDASGEGILTFNNWLASPAFVTNTGADRVDIEVLALNVEFEA